MFYMSDLDGGFVKLRNAAKDTSPLKKFLCLCPFCNLNSIKTNSFLS